MDKLFLKIQGIMAETPGAVFGLVNLEHVTKGWVVQVEGWQSLVGEDGMMEAIYRATGHTDFVAGYKHGSLEFWDVVDIFDNEAEATKAGIENGLMAIYQIETGRLKWLD